MRMFSSVSVAIVLLGIYCSNGAYEVPGDPAGASFTAWSLATFADPYIERVGGNAEDMEKLSLLRNAEGHVVSSFGIGAPLAAVPVFWLAAPFVTSWTSDTVYAVAKIAAAALTALSAGVLLLLLTEICTLQTATVLALVYGLGTCVWPVSAQGLWQHAPAGLLLLVGILAALNRPGWFYAGYVSGAALAWACLCRPTHGLALLGVGLFFAQDTVRLRRFILGAAPLIVLGLLWNKDAYGSWFAAGQVLTSPRIAVWKTGDASLWRAPFAGGAGLLISPSRGVFMFSPFLIFAAVGLLQGWRQKPSQARSLVLATSALAASFFVVSASWFDWWGGWSFGYRLLTDSIALWFLPLALWLQQAGRKTLALFAVAVVWSIMVQAAGAIAPNATVWNCGTPTHPKQDVDTHPARLWQVKDAQIPYTLGRRWRGAAWKQVDCS